MRFQDIGFAAYSTKPIQVPETEDSAVPGDCERCVNAVISIFSDFSIKVSISLGCDIIPLLWTYATSPSRFLHRPWRKYRINSFERIKTMAEKEITITAHGSPIPATWRSEPPCKTETIVCGGGGDKEIALLRFSVRYTGIGISADKICLLFLVRRALCQAIR